jgi:hypothetical protein
VLAPALWRGWQGLPDWARSLAVGGLLYAFIQGLMNVFAGGAGFFGYRLTLETLVCLFPALALTASHAGNVARTVLPPLLVVQVGVFAFGAAKDGFTMPPSEAWQVNSVAWAASTVPAFGVMLVLLAALTLLACRMLPTSWSWPTDGSSSRTQEPHERA